MAEEILGEIPIGHLREGFLLKREPDRGILNEVFVDKEKVLGQVFEWKVGTSTRFGCGREKKSAGNLAFKEMGGLDEGVEGQVFGDFAGDDYF